MKINRQFIYSACLLIGIASFYVISASAESEYWKQKVSLFDLLPINTDDIVFLGNSITDGGEFAELLDMHNIKNRGISSDVISGVKKRLDQVTNGQPKKIFLLIGINDVSHNLSVSELASEYRDLVKQIRKKTPGSTIYIQSVMPINNDFKRYKALAGKENVVNELNIFLRQIASEEGAIYVDLFPVLSDKTGKLKKEYTNDGLHLTGPGYKAWIETIEPYIKK